MWDPASLGNSPNLPRIVSFCLQNLRFSKTIRYESRKQLAQQRPRVRGQFIKHGGGGPGGGGLLLDDGATGTASNGAKSGVGGADGIGDVGGEDEVQTNSRGYYEVGCAAKIKIDGVVGCGPLA